MKLANSVKKDITRRIIEALEYSDQYAFGRILDFVNDFDTDFCDELLFKGLQLTDKSYLPMEEKAFRDYNKEKSFFQDLNDRMQICKSFLDHDLLIEIEKTKYRNPTYKKFVALIKSQKFSDLSQMSTEIHALNQGLFEWIFNGEFISDKRTENPKKFPILNYCLYQNQTNSEHFSQASIFCQSLIEKYNLNPDKNDYLGRNFYQFQDLIAEKLNISTPP